MPVRTGLLMFLLLAALSGCTLFSAREPRERFDAVPVTTNIPWLRFAELPDRLTNPLPIAWPTNDSCGEAVRIARERRAVIEQANCDRAEARGLSTNIPVTECKK